jgi:hypothetical protein
MVESVRMVVWRRLKCWGFQLGFWVHDAGSQNCEEWEVCEDIEYVKLLWIKAVMLSGVVIMEFDGVLYCRACQLTINLQ